MNIIDTGNFTIDVDLIFYIEKIDDDEKGYGLLIHFSNGKDLYKWYGLVERVSGSYYYFMNGKYSVHYADDNVIVSGFKRDGGKPRRDDIYDLLFGYLQDRK